jgi:tetratricopeptide (TPR) repeat protein
MSVRIASRPEMTMNSKQQLAVIVLLVGFAVFLILSKPLWWKEPAAAVDPDRIERMQERLIELERSQAATKTSLEEIARTLRSIDRSRQSATAEGVVVASRESGAAGPERGADAPGGGASRPADAKAAVESFLAALTDPKASWDDREAIWKRVRAAGLLEEVIKEFEKRAAANPKDPQAQTELGEAYLKKTEELGSSQEAGQYAVKADRAFDKALEIDPEHWESRFVKAVALSFWPPMFGKQTEAIKHFETLLAQQERQAPRSGFDDTYLYLGNMYQQLGQKERAISTWQRGLSLFPDNSELRQQIANAGH